MADKIALADTSMLIDLFRKTDKVNAQLTLLSKKGFSFSISAITEYEIYSGATSAQMDYWQDLLVETRVLSFGKDEVKVAVDINRKLKRKRQQIDLADLFITATAIANHLPLATLNRKHFDRIDDLNIIE